MVKGRYTVKSTVKAQAILTPILIGLGCFELNVFPPVRVDFISLGSLQTF